MQTTVPELFEKLNYLISKSAFEMSLEVDLEDQPATSSSSTQPATSSSLTQPATSSSSTQPATSFSSTQPATSFSSTQSATSASSTQPSSQESLLEQIVAERSQQITEEAVKAEVMRTWRENGSTRVRIL